jgi:PHD/YefM family antitoxin component YafN of YafNO toxin-antitoxin module
MTVQSIAGGRVERHPSKVVSSGRVCAQFTTSFLHVNRQHRQGPYHGSPSTFLEGATFQERLSPGLFHVVFWHRIVPVSDMAHKQQAVLEMADKEPVILAQRSKARAVLVSIQQWNELEARLKLLKALHEARVIEARADQANTWIPWEQTKARMKANA